jgi:DNA-binding transcriptional ArsR family regulator
MIEEKDSIKGLNHLELERMADTLKVIAHPVRISILGLLEDGSRLTVTEIYQKLDIEQAPASHHLGLLKSRGLLKSQREGKSNFYYVDREAISEVMCCFKRCTNTL